MSLTLEQKEILNPTQIYNLDGLLCFTSSEILASREDYESGDRCVGSIFEALEPGKIVELQDGVFILDDDLDLIDWFSGQVTNSWESIDDA